MHDGQVATSTDLVRRLLSTQLPHLAALPIRPVAEAGTDHALYRVGSDLVVRLPIIEGYPWPWSVVPWIAGATPDGENLDLAAAAIDLAQFVRALHAVPTTGGPLKSGTTRGVSVLCRPDLAATARHQIEAVLGDRR